MEFCMEDWAFGTTDNREKAKSLNMLRGVTCGECIFRHTAIRRQVNSWCTKKEEAPQEQVCEWWNDEGINQKEENLLWSLV